MLSTANYEAWKYGVKSAMPGFLAQKLCPELILIPEWMWWYKECSKAFKDVLRVYDEKLTGVGLDELYLDVTEYCELNGISNPD